MAEKKINQHLGMGVHETAPVVSMSNRLNKKDSRDEFVRDQAEPLVKLVLVGSDLFSSVSTGNVKFGGSAFVPSYAAESLLNTRNAEGDPMFVREEDLSSEKVGIRLIDPDSHYRCALFTVQGRTQVSVTADFAKHLLGRKRDGSPIFTRA